MGDAASPPAKRRRSTRVSKKPLPYVLEFADDIRAVLLKDEDEAEVTHVLEMDEAKDDAAAVRRTSSSYKQEKEKTTSKAES